MVEDRRVRASQKVMNQAIAEQAVKAALAKAAELGISMSVAKEFNAADTGGNMLRAAMHKMKKQR